MPWPLPVKLMIESLRLFFWIQTMSCISIFPRLDLQTIIYSLEHIRVQMSFVVIAISIIDGAAVAVVVSLNSG